MVDEEPPFKEKALEKRELIAARRFPKSVKIILNCLAQLLWNQIAILRAVKHITHPSQMPLCEMAIGDTEALIRKYKEKLYVE